MFFLPLSWWPVTLRVSGATSLLCLVLSLFFPLHTTRQHRIGWLHSVLLCSPVRPPPPPPPPPPPILSLTFICSHATDLCSSVLSPLFHIFILFLVWTSSLVMVVSTLHPFYLLLLSQLPPPPFCRLTLKSGPFFGATAFCVFPLICWHRSVMMKPPTAADLHLLKLPSHPITCHICSGRAVNGLLNLFQVRLLLFLCTLLALLKGMRFKCSFFLPFSFMLRCSLRLLLPLSNWSTLSAKCYY